MIDEEKLKTVLRVLTHIAAPTPSPLLELINEIFEQEKSIDIHDNHQCLFKYSSPECVLKE